MNQQFTKRMEGETAVFNLYGELTPTVTAALRKEFWDCLPEGNVRRLVVDLEHVPHLDSVGVSLLVATQNVVAKCRGCMVLIGLTPNNEVFLEQTHLDKYFTICDSLEEAMNRPLDAVEDAV